MYKRQYVSSQLMNALVGSFGLVAVTPMTALAASVLYTRRSRKGLARATEAEAPATAEV